MSRETPYGSWASPITAELIVQASVSLGGPAFAAGDLWWSELRPTEAGRVQIVRKPLDGPPSSARDVLPDGFSARTRVHEYGGGAWWLHDDTLFFTNWDDQRVYRIDHAGTDRATDPVAVTPEPEAKHAYRYADGEVTADGQWVVCVREWHGAPGASEARNEIVAFPADGAAEPTTLVGGAHGPDFVSTPRLDPDGRLLCWLQWNHPDMPWDATELWVADFETGSHIATPTTAAAARVAGGPGVSIAQPTWDSAGRLWFASDEAGGWWQLFAGSAAGRPAGDAVRVELEEDAEHAQPQWVFGPSWYDHVRDTVVAAYRRGGRDHLGDLPFTSIDGVTAADASDGRLAFIAATFTTEPEIVLSQGTERGASLEIQRPARDLGIDGDAWFSVPEHITFPTTPNADGSDAVAHALFYPPKNPDHHGPAEHAPPLIVMSHGGPTSAARPQLSLSVQYWTSRGFAVVDVNYRGSTGYGRAFREALNDRWGIADVEDCIAAARFLASEGRVDGERLAIRGGSAGGYTTLCALTFHDEFTAGASLYGVADLEALAKDTHKFESRYLDRLVGPYPEAKAVYEARSPIHHTDQLATPLIILQGLEDEVVPPAQAEMMVDALRAKGVPFAYVAFEGEQHGFRQAPNIRRALEAELYFYARVFGFELVDDIDPVLIEFL
jgi:dipeptidyl aminopeptidase/acylaminoacyl peptidase